MTAPFDFPAWLQATGWSHPEAARRLGLDPKTVTRMANSKAPVTDRTIGRCLAATQRQIATLQPYVEGLPDLPNSPA